MSEKDFSLFICAPSVTGDLHLGHALMAAIQDAIVRWKRMHNYNVNFYFGTDAAGFATEKVVERHLLKQGIKKDNLTRKEFLNHIWEWIRLYDKRIYEQFKKMEISCDWDNKLFTMSPKYSEAVLKSFIRFYEAGYIYKGKYPANICLNCATSLSDLEVDINNKKKILEIVYFQDSKGKNIPVAYREIEDLLETKGILLDNYRDVLKNETHLYNPLTKEWIPIIINKDLHVVELGDGLESIENFATPLLPTKRKLHFKHYKNLLGQDKSGEKNIFSKEYILNKLANLKAYGYKIEREINQEFCSKCLSEVSVEMSDQWFLKTEELANQLKERIQNGEVKFYPESGLKKSLEWLDSIEDWCISRQIALGHRIPAWKCLDCNEYTISLNTIEECSSCKSTRIEEIKDVLDTWFSGAHYFFANLGWPDDLEQLNKNYPVSLIETGHDILFFWVIRNMLLSLFHTGKLPANKVLLHGLVLDKSGSKMSKSKGNTINALEVLENPIYGPDVIRYGLLMNCEPGKDVMIDMGTFDIAKSVIDKVEKLINSVNTNQNYDIQKIKIHNDLYRWMFREQMRIYETMDDRFDNFDFRTILYEISNFINRSFLWITSIKEKNHQEFYFLVGTLITILEPILPKLSEQGRKKLGWNISITNIKQMYREYTDIVFSIEDVDSLLNNLLQLEAVFNKKVASKIELEIIGEEGSTQFVDLYKDLIRKQTNFNSIDKDDSGYKITFSSSIDQIIFQFNIPNEYGYTLKNLDKYLRSEIRKMNKELKEVKRLLDDTNFIYNAPQDKVQETRKKKASLKNKINSYTNTIQKMYSLY